MNPEQRELKHPQVITPKQVKHILELANSIKHGSITLVFQDGVLVQIEKSEKIRISKSRD